MTEVELEAPVSLSQLEYWGIFDGCELIVDVNRSKTRMTTISRTGEETLLGNSIRVNYYDIKPDGRRIVSIDNNGFDDSSPDRDRKDYLTLDKTLAEAGL